MYVWKIYFFILKFLSFLAKNPGSQETMSSFQIQAKVAINVIGFSKYVVAPWKLQKEKKKSSLKTYKWTTVICSGTRRPLYTKRRSDLLQIHNSLSTVQNVSYQNYKQMKLLIIVFTLLKINIYTFRYRNSNMLICSMLLRTH